jgi:hypothetical protein
MSSLTGSSEINKTNIQKKKKKQPENVDDI